VVKLLRGLVLLVLVLYNDDNTTKSKESKANLPMFLKDAVPCYKARDLT